MEYHYARELYGYPARVTVHYLDMNIHPAFPGDHFETKQFLYKKGKEWLPAPPYQDYELIIE